MATSLIQSVKGVGNNLVTLNHRIDTFAYWCHPTHWVQGVWQYTDTLFKSGNADIYLLVGTIAAIWLIMLGAEKPKKYLFWTWIVFWILRGAVFA